MTRTKRHSQIVVFLGIVCTLGLCTAASGVQFAGGTGEPNDPYQIATAEQLIAVGGAQVPLSGYFKLVADIDLGGKTWTAPVIPSCAAVLDGDGHTIRDLRCKGIIVQGLVGYLERSGRILNLNVVNTDVMSTNYAGALVAQNAGTVVNCSSSGSVAGMGSNSGGLVGYNQGTINNSHSSADVLGSSAVGGLVGNNAGFVTDCESTGQVLGEDNAGGLVGSNVGCVSTSCSSSSVTGYSYVGGLVGYNTGGIATCYSTGSVAGLSQAGGLVGSNSGRLLSCYSTAAVLGQGNSFGCLVGTNSTVSGSNVTGCYVVAPAGVRGPNDKIGTALTADQMKQQASFVGWDFWGTTMDGTADTWFMPPNAYPALAWQTETTQLVAIPDLAGLSLDQAKAALTAAGLAAGAVSEDYHRTIPSGGVILTYPRSFARAGGMVDLVLSLGRTYNWAQNPGDGTIANPCWIQTPGQLESLGDHSELLDKCFVLTADLDMTGRTYPTALIAPDANDSVIGFQGTAFTGSFNGNKHAVQNLRIVDDRHSAGKCLGLFGMIDKPGQVSGLTLTDVTILGGSGSDSVPAGAVAGYNSGTVVDCSATGVMSVGCTYADGFIGTNYGSVVNCHNDVTVLRLGCSAVRR